jgi:hypothetical protein
MASLLREAGPFGLLIFLCEFSAPVDWNGDHPGFTNRSNPIWDDEICERLEISMETLSSLRTGLREDGLLDWSVLPDGGCVYLFGAINLLPEGDKLWAPLRCERDGYPIIRASSLVDESETLTAAERFRRWRQRSIQ